MNDKHTSLLIIGNSEYTNKTCKVEHYETLSAVGKDYNKESDLYKAFKTAKDYGAPSIYLVNMRTISDFINITNQLIDYDFAYICPTKIMFSDKYTDRFNLDLNSFYLNDLSFKCYKNRSMIFVTDKHASLYGDIDDFNKDYADKVQAFMSVHNKRKFLDNVICVGNNLKHVAYSNICLAARLAATPINSYPAFLNEDTVFTLDYKDMIPNVCYFKNNYRTGTTIENLVNLSNENPNKSVMVMRIVNYLVREMDFDEYIGKNYRKFYLTKIKERLDNLLKQNVGFILYDYHIDSVEEQIRDNGYGVDIILRYTLYPLFTTESYTAEQRL